jgi:hypothetical protein
MAQVNAAMNQTGRPAERGGLNFWQWLGIAIIVLGGLFYLWRNLRSEPEGTPPREDQPAPTQAQSAPATTQSESGE